METSPFGWHLRQHHETEDNMNVIESKHQRVIREFHPELHWETKQKLKALALERITAISQGEDGKKWLERVQNEEGEILRLVLVPVATAALNRSKETQGAESSEYFAAADFIVQAVEHGFPTEERTEILSSWGIW